MSKKIRRAALALVPLAALAFTQSEAQANPVPYGGCKEAGVNPQSDGARWCREHGWIVRARFTVDPYGRATTGLPALKREDGTIGYWDAVHRGNHRGDGYIALPGRLVFVDFVNGTRVTTHPHGRWVVVPTTG